MQNSTGYNIPVFLVKGVKTSGHVSDLKPLELGIFDRSTYSVATASGNGTEFFLAGGKPHTKDEFSKFYKGMKEPKMGSFFKGKDLIAFEKVFPQVPENEEWVFGYNGDPNSKSLLFEKNKQYMVKVRLFGEYVYRKYQRSVERVIHLDTFVCGDGSCTGDCEDQQIDRIKSTKAWAEKIQNDVELSEFGLQVHTVFDNWAATTPNRFNYSINVWDNGDADALFTLQRAYPALTIERTAFSKGVSTYTVKDRPSGAPANFTPTADVLLAVCGACPAGYTTVAGFDSWIVTRQLSVSDDLDNDAAKTAFAAAVVTAYSATVGTGVFLGIADGAALVKFNIASGTAVAPAADTSDIVEKVASTPTTCTPAAPAAISWTESDAGYVVTRNLTVTVNALDCAEGVQAVTADVIASLASVPSYVSGSASDITAVGQACSKTFQITQRSKMMKDKCESADLAEFDALPTFEGLYWTPAVDTSVNTTVKAGIRIAAPFGSIKFGDSSFAPDEFYDSKPIQMEVSVYDQSGNPCSFTENGKGVKVKEGKYSRLSGEHVAREIIKGGAYFTFEQWSMDPRMREVMDNNVLSTVDRKKYYVAYYLKFKESRGDNNFGQFGQIWEPVLFVEEGATSVQTALENALQAVTAKFDVELKKRV
jgi:hypothetical protein